MRTLLGTTSPSKQVTQDAVAQLEQLQRQKSPRISDAITATPKNGNLYFDQMVNFTIAEAVRGAFWDGLLGSNWHTSLTGPAIGERPDPLPACC